ncbi:MAG: globin-coupled sensor protein [Actinobacteria bacterium]|nr:globin-coupled sensor protein [Actinomycetota bacterium]MBV8562003.1 globin-coupled sensor protein [Actinomycetota bacterium]
MGTLASLYRLNETNVAHRRQFMRLDARDVAVLKRTSRWADRAADRLAKEFYDHQFAFAPTRAFFAAYASRSGRSLDDLRRGLEAAQAGYFRGIFREAASGGHFGVEYFENRLKVGRLHNTIDLPIKWYIGSYALYFDLVRKYLRRRYPHRPDIRSRTERALIVVMLADMQAIVEAFYFDTFETMGVDLTRVSVESHDLDLSDKGQDLKALVKVPLEGIARTLESLRAASGQLTTSTGQTSTAVTEIAGAVSDVAQGAERQVRMVEDVKQTAEDAAAAAAEARTTSDQGVESASRATGAMEAVRESSTAASASMGELATKSEQIGGIVETISGIASQTNLLALNAAIEAARAGEQGRGFAVVAEEVRKLAEGSQQAATTISGLIAEIQQGTAETVAVVERSVKLTEEGTTVVEDARSAFTAIGERVSEIASRIEQMAAATSELAAVAEQSSASAQQVSASTQETSASTQEIAAAAEQLAGTADDLEEIVQGFNLAVG